MLLATGLKHCSFALFPVIRLDTYIDGNFLESYLGDGVVASPPGSTGYSLSTGVLSIRLELLVVTPICPTASPTVVIATSKETILMKVSSGVSGSDDRRWSGRFSLEEQRSR